MRVQRHSPPGSGARAGVTVAVARDESGFTLVELLVSMVITLVVMGATLTAMVHAMRASESASAVTGMNSNLRNAMDLVVRDLIQVGQGLPTGRVVQIPAGAGATPINRPGPVGAALTFDPAATELAAVTPGPDLGPEVNGQPTDILTTIAGDTAFDQVPLVALTTTSLTVASNVAVPGAVDITDGGPDDIQVGDLMMLTKGAFSTLVYVTRTEGQQVFFEADDPMALNQTDPTLTLTGTIDQLRNAAPADVLPGGPAAEQFLPTRATRIRMVTYYLNATLDPTTPRLMRRLNWGTERPAGSGEFGATVGFAVENLQITYDLVDGVTNPANVRMTAEDLAGGGACGGAACSVNQVRKVSVFLGGRSLAPFSTTRQFFRNSLTSQVSLRSLAFVDRYR